jgi:hypothetical protein
MTVRLARLVASLVISGLALLMVGIALSLTPARAANIARASISTTQHLELHSEVR